MSDRVTAIDRTEVARSAQPDPGDRARAALLRMGRIFQDKGHLYEASYTFHKLLDDYPDTRTSRAAMNALADLAEHAEENGLMQLALSLFHEIDKLSQEGVGYSQ